MGVPDKLTGLEEVLVRRLNCVSVVLYVQALIIAPAVVEDEEETRLTHIAHLTQRHGKVAVEHHRTLDMVLVYDFDVVAGLIDHCVHAILGDLVELLGVKVSQRA